MYNKFKEIEWQLEKKIKRVLYLASPRDGFPPDEAEGIPDRSCPDPDELPRPEDDPDNPSMLKIISF